MSCDKSRRVMTYFNSRPSARGDDFKNQFGDMDFISIHAPPRGATCPHCRLLRRVAHFNSRPSARGDLRTVRQPARNVYFNSRPSARGDVSHRPHPRTGLHFNSRPSARGDQRREVRRSARRISIHAPPRGATCRREAGIASNLFQFTPLREGRRDRLYADGGRAEFQFTPLREGRPAAGQAWRGYNRFQFTPLREGRPIRSSRLRRGLYLSLIHI